MTDHSEPRRRWDPIVRITHWSIVLAVVSNALITEKGSGPHIWVGYGLAAILGLRLLWGLIGPSEARFSAFRPSPRRALEHLREIRQGIITPHRSHNPLGALMVYAIWSCLLTIIATGVVMAGPPPWTGAEREQHGAAIVAATSAADAAEEGEDSESGEESEGGEEGEEGPLGEVHEAAANLLYLLILLHLAGVAFETRRAGKQVIVAMAPFQR